MRRRTISRLLRATIVTATLAAAACSGSQSHETSTNTAATHAAASSEAGVTPPPPPPPPGTVRVTGVAFVEHDTHCGGAAIPESERYADRQPAADATYVVRAGRTNTDAPIAATVRADAQGRFFVDLPAGTWCFLSEDRATPPRPSVPGADRHQSCLDSLNANCDAMVTTAVGSVPEPLRLLRYVNHCFPPCYDGPAPP